VRPTPARPWLAQSTTGGRLAPWSSAQPIQESCVPGWWNFARRPAGRYSYANSAPTANARSAVQPLGRRSWSTWPCMPGATRSPHTCGRASATNEAAAGTPLSWLPWPDPAPPGPRAGGRVWRLTDVCAACAAATPQAAVVPEMILAAASPPDGPARVRHRRNSRGPDSPTRVREMLNYLAAALPAETGAAARLIALQWALRMNDAAQTRLPFGIAQSPSRAGHGFLGRAQPCVLAAARPFVGSGSDGSAARRRLAHTAPSSP
jgi:hypothetical protein